MKEFYIMSKNINLIPVTDSSKILSDEKTEIEFKNDLENIKVSLIDHTPWPHIVQYLPNYVNTKVSADSNLAYSPSQNADDLEKAFKSTTLPSILETIRLFFRVEGISVQDALRLIRHHTLSFSAQCTDDHLSPDFKTVVPESIENSPEFYKRYKDLTQLCHELYAEMIESKKISTTDAHLILNKNHDNFYHVSCNFKDLLGFVKQHIDQQNQSKSINILAYQMWLAVCQQYPIAHLNLVDYEQPSYCNSENLNGTNPPNKKTKFESMLTEYKGDLVFFSETATEHIEMIRKGEIFTIQPE